MEALLLKGMLLRTNALHGLAVGGSVPHCSIQHTEKAAQAVSPHMQDSPVTPCHASYADQLDAGVNYSCRRTSSNSLTICLTGSSAGWMLSNTEAESSSLGSWCSIPICTGHQAVKMFSCMA